MRPLIMGLLLVLAALAGCAGDTDDTTPPGNGDGDGNGGGPGPDPTPDPGNGDDNGDGPKPDPSPSPEPENTPPTASLSASIQQGSIPLNVTFSLDGSDPDGGAVTWSLDLGDGTSTEGDELPATHEHAYTQEGLYTVVFTVSDGTDATTQDLTINAMEAAEEALVLAGNVLMPDPWGITLDGCLMEVARSDAGDPDGTEGVFGQKHELDPTVWGWSYSFDGEGLYAEFWQWNGDVDLLGGGEAGEVPQGATIVMVCINDPTVFDVEYQLTLSPP